MTTTTTTATEQLSDMGADEGTTLLTLQPSPSPRNATLTLSLTPIEAEFLRFHGYTPSRISALLHAGVQIDAVHTLARLAVGTRARQRVTMALSTSGTSQSLLDLHPYRNRVLLAHERLSEVEMPARERSAVMGLLRILSEGEQPRTHEVYVRLHVDAWEDFAEQAREMEIPARRLMRGVLAEAVALDMEAKRVRSDAAKDGSVPGLVLEGVDVSPLARLGDAHSLPLGEFFQCSQERLQTACMNVLHEGGLHTIEECDVTVGAGAGMTAGSGIETATTSDAEVQARRSAFTVV